MKNMKKFFALLLTVVMVLSMGVTAFAENSDGESYTRGSITIKNPQEGVTYSAYKIFDVTYDLGGTGTDDDKYAYTINPVWVDDVIAYTGATADANGVYTGKGLTLTPVKNTAGTITCYNVTFQKDAIPAVEDDPNTAEDESKPAVPAFSAPDFGEKMAAMTTGKSSTAFTVVDGKTVAKELDLGYYMIQPSSANALVSLTTTDADVIVSDKNEKPVVDKKILPEERVLICTKQSTDEGAANYEANHEHSEANGCYAEKDYTTKSVGDKVPYQLETKVPDMTGYDPYFFVMNDTMTAGLTFNEDVKILIGGKDQTQKELIKGTDYSVKITNNENGTTNIRIVFNNMKTNYWRDVEANDWEGEPIVITYSATVDEDAVMGTTGNTNTVYIEYSNNPNIKPEWNPDGSDDDDPDKNDPLNPNYKHNQDEDETNDPIGKSAEDKVTVYTAELDITKIDANGGATLTGAKFKIAGDSLNVSIINTEIFEVATDGTWYRLKDGTYTEEAPVNMTAEGASTEPTYEKVTVDPVTYTKLTGDDAVAGVGLYYSETEDGEKTLITNENLSAAEGKIIWQPTYNAVGYYYKSGENSYAEITVDNAAEHITGDIYKKILHKASDKYEDTTVKYKKVEVIEKNVDGDKVYPYEAEGFVGANGVITFGGLAEGTYYITELIAPDGYNLLKDPIKVVVELVQDTNDTTGKTYKFQATIDEETTAKAEADGHISFNVENNQGVELPETGGMGTTMFYVIGGILLVGASILLITRRRMSAEG